MQTDTFSKLFFGRSEMAKNYKNLVKLLSITNVTFLIYKGKSKSYKKNQKKKMEKRPVRYLICNSKKKKFFLLKWVCIQYKAQLLFFIFIRLFEIITRV